jgi:hypothetical protein
MAPPAGCFAGSIRLLSSDFVVTHREAVSIRTFNVENVARLGCGIFIRAVTVVGDSAQHCHRLPRRRGLYRRVRADRIPATPQNRPNVLGELIDDNDGFLAQFGPFF